MSAPQNFRSAFNGFNREDVVHYLEYLNARHTSQVNQLTSEAEYLRNKLETAQSDPEVVQERDALRERVAELEAHCAQLEQQLAQTPAPTVTVREETVSPTASEELEAYRRAERAERMAKERSELVYHQVSGVLAEASSKVDGVADEIGAMAEQVMQQLVKLQAAVAGSKDILCDAASTINAIKPNN